MSGEDAAARLDFDRLGPEVTAAFAESGVVCLRGLLDAGEVEDLRAWIEVAIANPSPRFAGAPGRTYAVDTHLWTKFEGFRKVAFDSRIAEAAATVMGSRQVRLYYDNMFVKEPAAPEPTPWHQDLPYYRLGGRDVCSAWIALDPANAASGAMTYGLGTHGWGKMFRSNDDGDAGPAAFAPPFAGPAPDLDREPGLCPTVTFDLGPGDVVFHHLLTLHKAGPNTTRSLRRRVHTIRLAGDDAIWAERPFWKVAFETELPDGAPLDGPEFPILWPRA
jgi:ectoine hydroxylase-related dioxygenase (phytanoyl-CoA dioxygenase family)